MERPKEKNHNLIWNLKGHPNYPHIKRKITLDTGTIMKVGTRKRKRLLRRKA
jgi:hypothetical protein